MPDQPISDNALQQVQETPLAPLTEKLPLTAAEVLAALVEKLGQDDPKSI